jgi:hypothetical protein
MEMYNVCKFSNQADIDFLSFPKLVKCQLKRVAISISDESNKNSSSIRVFGVVSRCLRPGAECLSSVLV